jgi:amino acid transporter
MKHGERIAPVAASIAALSTLACCLPLGFAAAAMTATASIAIGKMRMWFLGASVVLVVLGFIQLHRARACGRSSRASTIVMWLCTAIVILALVFPQVLATLLA